MVRWPNGELKSSPFHVRFGKLKVVQSENVMVNVEVNGIDNSQVAMLLGQAGEAVFVHKNPVTHEAVRSLTATSEQLKSLGLHDGENTVRFSVESNLQGKQEVVGKIFLLNWDAKIVISDVDGTITKSDVPGHILPRLGMDWTQPSICDLFQKIKSSGYQMLYLSARPIG